MKIVCIGRNYGEHAKELGNAVPDEPVVFLKPPSALVPLPGPIVLPAFSKDVQHEVELVYTIARRNGHAVADKVTLGLDLTARDLQQALKAKGLPWEKAKAFDGSAYVAGTFTALESFPAGHHIEFMLKKNGHVVQSGHSGQMLFGADELIAHVERYMALGPGDMLFTGTPAGVGALAHGDRLEGYLLGELVFDLAVEGPVPAPVG
ncbi:MAG: fumarylacetoacetate hydrolase family protein [Flavobacteriales bacterium]|jgi:2-keto-4-pentenoate hydratase/2-oxohepta-3-ene-1,7-dioic acid hydratase in catechol pathway|nr:fumarylacetoacetate hydrolase family protein [Flavobacteriales bacterium]